MTAADRAIAILRAGLPPRAAAPESRASMWAKSKCVFARTLNDAPFPANPPPSIISRKVTRRSKYFGTWLQENNPELFNRMYEEWRSAQ